MDGIILVGFAISERDGFSTTELRCCMCVWNEGKSVLRGLYPGEIVSGVEAKPEEAVTEV